MSSRGNSSRKSYSRCLDIVDISQENAAFSSHSGQHDVILFFETYNRQIRPKLPKEFDIWIRNLLPLFGRRLVYNNNEEPLFGYNEMAQLQRHTFYTQLASTVISRLYGSGIQQYLEEIILPSRRLNSTLYSHSVLRDSLKTPVIFSSYARMYVERQHRQSRVTKTKVNHEKLSSENKGVFHRVNLEEVSVCWWIVIDILCLSIVVFCMENLSKKLNSTRQQNNEIPTYVYLK